MFLAFLKEKKPLKPIFFGAVFQPWLVLMRACVFVFLDLCQFDILMFVSKMADLSDSS